MRFVLRHFTAILILAAVAGWAVFYLPNSPTWAVLRLKQSIDARDGNQAAKYVDFESVVKKAGHEMVQKQGTDPLSAMLGNAAIDMLSKPMAQVAQAWAVKKVDDGAREVQMPGAAVAGAIVVLHRNGDTAATDFTDNKGQRWRIHLARGDDGYWRVTEIEDVEQLLQKLQRNQPMGMPSP
ncbi:MAG TPA: DUF2939 domain-containing protein [Candidatus Binatus sp.]|uniref:DUF2939 domain-containing protein n=1 Tax=Candidatus Binatus sp. TaxID=2811406 RepID=UPI002F3E407C